MRGHEPLLAMRRAGFAPQAAWLGLDANPLWRDWPLYGSHAQIEIELGEAINRLDLRCLVGMQVWIDGSDERRVLDLHTACLNAHAKRVLSAVNKPNYRGEPTVARMLDSDESCTWPS